ncbi:unnamed protein product [Brassica oleracea var. botrytis]|uniref:(rape) hypothetical protein n=1 Tax=Brassica napus TaxID=3708 RepID=A0A816LB90_BRANA|nr:unnamed protein product [Brassica napus]
MKQLEFMQLLVYPFVVSCILSKSSDSLLALSPLASSPGFRFRFLLII